MDNKNDGTFNLYEKGKEVPNKKKEAPRVNPITAESGAGAHMGDPNAEVALYNPSQYGFLGFIFSLVPVFFMSFSNAKFLPNGEVIRNAMKKFLTIFILMFVVHAGVLAFSSVSLIKALDVAAQENTAGAMNLYYSYEMGFSNIDDVMMELVPKEILLYDKVLSYSGEIFAGLNLILLIFVTRFTSKNELTVYKELNEAKRVKTKRFLIPVLIGIAFSIGIYFGFPILLGIFTDLLV